ncbi:hypothetical protein F5Y14DRAFT_446562 [Nemania sp. NC0429]|nr:hypothetical protein F5Y14DRAFT_446562 [Nemania sp. NC0429]
MEISHNPAAYSDSQPRKRKGRNSDIRKEQNRIASRAYREKRRQKLALLEEILKSDSHNDSMSSVSDETEYGSMTPVSEPRAVKPSSRTRHSSNSPTPYYVPAVPTTLTLLSEDVRTLPSNGISREMDDYVGYCAKDRVPDAEKFGRHAEYSGDPRIPTVRITPGYVPPLPSATPMPPTPIFPFSGETMGDSFGAYPLPDDSVPGFLDTQGYDSNMVDALRTLSRLNDSQQRQIIDYLLKKNNITQSTVTDHISSPSYSGYVPAPGMGLLQ